MNPELILAIELWLMLFCTSMAVAVIAHIAIARAARAEP